MLRNVLQPHGINRTRSNFKKSYKEREDENRVVKEKEIKEKNFDKFI
jgi:hypothetical protein